MSLKTTELAVEAHRQIEAEERRIRFENRLNMNSSTVPTLILQMKEKNADEWAAKLYQIYCDVWKTQGYERSGAFVRAVYSRAILVALRARAGSIKHEFLMWARRTSFSGTLTNAHMNGLQLRMQRLQDHWFRRLEAEAKELEHAERRLRGAASMRPSSSMPQGNEPTPTSTAQTDNRPTDLSLREAIIRKVRNPHAYTNLLVSEAALYFEVMGRTIYRWVAEGKLKSGGRRGSITIESICRWEAKRARKRPS